MERYKVISPVGGSFVDRKNIASRLQTLQGKTIGETWNEDFKGDFMFPVYRELLRERYPGVKVVPTRNSRLPPYVELRNTSGNSPGGLQPRPRKKVATR